MNRNQDRIQWERLFRYRPTAVAVMAGSPEYPGIRGPVRFYQTAYGVLVVAEMEGLPDFGGNCEAPIFGFHIHEGAACAGHDADPFADAGTHYSPVPCPHPYHAGDLPPLFGAGGIAFSAVLTNRFAVEDILGKTVILHGSADDFTTQPSGNAGIRIACGEIIGMNGGF